MKTQPDSTRRRTGKIARLPEEIRNQVNELLDDGIEYPRIVDWLSEQGYPGFNHMNISRWKDGGYQDWLRHYARLDELELKLKWAAQVTSSTQDNQLHQASLALTSLQFYEMMNRFDPAALSRILESHPDKYPTLINAFARFTREMVGLHKFKDDQQEKARRLEQTKRTDKGGLTAEGRRRVRQELRLACDEPETVTEPLQDRSKTDTQPL